MIGVAVDDGCSHIFVFIDSDEVVIKNNPEVFMSSSVHQRTKESPGGDIGNPIVVASNIIAANMMFTLVVATSRGVHVGVEQPGSSMFFTGSPYHAASSFSG